MEPNRLLAIAVATGRIGVVFFVGERLMDWRISNRAAVSRVAAAGHAQTLINELKPHVLVIERVTDTSHKGKNTKTLIEAIARIGAQNELLDVAVARECGYPNKYVEADALANRYPDIAPWKGDCVVVWTTQFSNGFARITTGAHSVGIQAITAPVLVSRR